MTVPRISTALDGSGSRPFTSPARTGSRNLKGAWARKRMGAKGAPDAGRKRLPKRLDAYIDCRACNVISLGYLKELVNDSRARVQRDVGLGRVGDADCRRRF